MSIINGLEYTHIHIYTGRSERKKSRGRRNDIGAGTGPAGPAMAGPFSAEVDTIITRSTFVWSQIAVLKFGRVRT